MPSMKKLDWVAYSLFSFNSQSCKIEIIITSFLLKDSKYNTEICFCLFNSRANAISNMPINQTSFSHEKKMYFNGLKTPRTSSQQSIFLYNSSHHFLCVSLCVQLDFPADVMKEVNNIYMERNYFFLRKGILRI